MEFAIDRFNDSVKFALERISKASLQLSPHQMNALQSILSGKDTFVCLPTGQGKSILFECFPHCYDFLHSCESEQSQPYRTAVVLSDVGRFGNGERRADDGESGTGLDAFHYSFRGSEESGCR